MIEKMFLPEVYKKGLQLHKEDCVYHIQKTSNRRQCKVRDEQHYHTVVIAFDRNNKIIGMNCTCHDAKEGKYCCHEAALLIRLNQSHNTRGESRESLHDLLKKYPPYVDGYPHPIDLNKFVDKVSNILSNLTNGVNASNNLYIIEQLELLLDEYSIIDLPKKISSLIDLLFISQFQKVFTANKKSISHYLSWFENCLKKEQNLTIIDLLVSISIIISYDLIIPSYLKVVQSEKAFENEIITECFEKYIFTIILKSPKHIEAFMLAFKEYNHVYYDFFRIFYLQYLKLEQETFEAVTLFKTNYPNHELNKELYSISQQMSQLSMTNEEYAKEVISIYRRKENHKKTMYLDKLKKKYGESWKHEKYKIYEQIKETMSNSQYISFLQLNRENDVAIYDLIKNPSLDNFLSFEFFLDYMDMDTYYLLLLECIIADIDNNKIQDNTHMLKYHLDCFEYNGIFKRVLEEIFLYIRQNYDHQIEMLEFFNTYLKERQY